MQLIDGDSCVAGKLGDQKIDVVVGTDVIYWRNSIVPLIDTFDALVEHNHPELEFYICYIERHKNTHEELRKKLKERGYKITQIGKEITQELNENSYMYSITKQK